MCWERYLALEAASASPAAVPAAPVRHNPDPAPDAQPDELLEPAEIHAA